MKSKSEKSKDFNPNDTGVPNGRYFGMPYEDEECTVVLISVPWDATVSYSAGTAEGPGAIIDASVQVDLFDSEIKRAEETKIGTADAAISYPDRQGEMQTFKTEEFISSLSEAAREKAVKVIAALEKGKLASSVQKFADEVNAASEQLNIMVENICSAYIKEGKIIGLVGGEHSVSFGAIRAVADALESKRGQKGGKGLGVLQIDAHADLRKAYEGFEYSHASIMYNVISKIGGVSKLCQVAIRDFCSDEDKLMRGNKKISSFTDNYIQSQQYKGKTWDKICDEIIASLPENVYISFDIDGLEPSCCPNTGTPVPGGITFDNAIYLLRKLSGKRKIAGFDLCEVAPAYAKGDMASGAAGNEWDANVGARVLHKLCLFALRSCKK